MKKLCCAIVMCLTCASGWAAEKAWLSDETTRFSQGDMHISLNKDHARNAEWGTFQANLLNRTNGISIAFHDKCRAYLKLEVRVVDTRKIDLTAFSGSQVGSNLPINAELDVMRKTLADQCEDLQVLRLEFAAQLQTEGNLSYVGTLTKKNAWRLQDGIVATAYDKHYRFDFGTRDHFNLAGVHHSGACSNDPVLTLGLEFSNNSERALAQQPKMTNVIMTAQVAAKAYAAECPGTERIRYILNPLPQDYECAAQGDCFLSAQRKGEEWAVSTSELKPQEYYDPVKDFDDFTEVLAAGEFPILNDYTSFFAFYFESFISSYSDHCRGHISDPVGRDIQTVERRFDSSGALVNEKNLGPKRRIWIEGTYVDSFDRYFDSWKAWATRTMINTMADRNPNQQLGLVGRSASTAMAFFSGNIGQLERLLDASCTNQNTQAAYVNMLRFAQGKPPVDAGFTTDKRPYEKPVKNGNSAPAMAQLLADRATAATQGKSQEQLAYEAQEQQKRDAYQQRIRDEIAKRNAPRNQPAPQPAQVPKAGATGVQAQRAVLVEYTTKLQEMNEVFQAQLRAAKTPEAKQALQLEHKQLEAEMGAKYHKLLMGQ